MHRGPSEGSRFFQILAEPRSQLVQRVGVRARDGSPLDSQCCCLKDPLLHMALLIFPAGDETDVFPLFQRVVTLKDEAFVLGFNKGKASGKAGEDSAHPASDDLLETFHKRDFFLVESGIFGNGKNEAGRMPFLEFESDVLNAKLVAGKRQAILLIKVSKVRELASELVSQTWVGEELPVAVAFAPLHERRDQCMLVVHGTSVTQTRQHYGRRRLRMLPD